MLVRLVFSGGDELASGVYGCCPEVSIAVNWSEPREGGTRNRAYVAGGLGFGGVGSDDGIVKDEGRW